jgi:hypothetical protein
MIEDMRVRNLSPATQRSYVHAVSKFSRFFGRSPETLTLDDVRTFQVHLAAKRVAWASLNQTVAALRFFYGVTLGLAEVPERIACARDHVAQEIGVRSLLHQAPQGHHLVGHREVSDQVGFRNPTITEDRAMTTAPPGACQRDNPRRQPRPLPASYTTNRGTTGRTILIFLGVAKPAMERREWTDGWIRRSRPSWRRLTAARLPSQDPALAMWASVAPPPVDGKCSSTYPSRIP